MRLVLKEMKALGAMMGGIRVYLVGGAEMLSGGGILGNVGERNAEASFAALKAAGLHVNDSDLGGNHGRTVRLEVATGELTVSSAGREPRLLSAALRAAA